MDGVLDGRRIVVVDDDAEQRDELASALRSCGATVAELSPSGGGLPQSRALLPEVVVYRTGVLESDAGLALVDALRADPLVRWAATLTIDSPAGSEALKDELRAIGEADSALAERLRTATETRARLRPHGPLAWLQAIDDAGVPLRATFRSDGGSVVVAMSGGHVVRAQSRDARGGTLALADLLELDDAEVVIEHLPDVPASIGAPLASAIGAAVLELDAVSEGAPSPSGVVLFGEGSHATEEMSADEIAHAVDAHRALEELRELQALTGRAAASEPRRITSRKRTLEMGTPPPAEQVVAPVLPPEDAAPPTARESGADANDPEEQTPPSTSCSLSREQREHRRRVARQPTLRIEAPRRSRKAVYALTVLGLVAVLGVGIWLGRMLGARTASPAGEARTTRVAML